MSAPDPADDWQTVRPRKAARPWRARHAPPVPSAARACLPRTFAEVAADPTTTVLGKILAGADLSCTLTVTAGAGESAATVALHLRGRAITYGAGGAPHLHVVPRGRALPRSTVSLDDLAHRLIGMSRDEKAAVEDAAVHHALVAVAASLYRSKKTHPCGGGCVD